VITRKEYKKSVNMSISYAMMLCVVSEAATVTPTLEEEAGLGLGMGLGSSVDSAALSHTSPSAAAVEQDATTPPSADFCSTDVDSCASALSPKGVVDPLRTCACGSAVEVGLRLFGPVYGFFHCISLYDGRCSGA